MSRPTRIGFTLVELLVVIVIISMLVGLLLPAVQMARARARQTECMNNQHEIALAVLQYETAKGQFPGYVNKFGTSPTSNSDTRLPLSWTTVILPYLGNEAAWREWRAQDNSAIPANLRIRVPQYVCPSNVDAGKTSLSYAANSGIKDVPVEDPNDSDNWLKSAVWESPVSGVFQNRYVTDKLKVTSSSIRDGASNTLMFTENIQGGNWFADNDVSTKEKLLANERYLGVVWWATAPTNACYEINACKDAPVFTPNAWVCARPSSNHTGGVVATLCDGHQRFLSERIQYETYKHLMTPDSRGAGLSAQLDDPELAVE